MGMKQEKRECKLCKKLFLEEELSEEHYPAKCVGNLDIITFDVKRFIDKSFLGKKSIDSPFYDNEISKSIYPNGRTNKCLCRDCNSFLGKYDEAYLKFFNNDGNPKMINGFSKETKINIIKSIYGKFLSIPETNNENFDFLDFVRNPEIKNYSGNWNIWFVKRDFTSDFLGLKNIETGKIPFDKGIVYELSDDKFIFNLMNFEKHSEYQMTNIFEILNKNYNLINGVGDKGGYHASILFSNLLSQGETK